MSKTPDQAAIDAARDAGEEGFAALIAELEPLAKAIPSAAADLAEPEAEDADEAEADQAEPGEDDAAAEAAAEDDEADAAEDDAGEPFGKSFSVTLADGTEAEAFDGTAMLKALHAENVALKAQGAGMAKALTSVAGLVKGMHGALAEQAALIKSLRADVRKLGAQGAGRKAVLSIAEKPSPAATLAKAEAPSIGDVFAKANSLIASGKLTGFEAARVTSHVNSGRGIPADLAPLFADTAA